MKKPSCSLRIIAAILSGTMFFTSCASTTLIESIPTGAKLYVDEEPVGATPYSYSDTKIVGSSILLRIEKEGYEPLKTYISRNEEVDVGAVIGGFLVLVPFLWTMKYKPTHTYELTPLAGKQQPTLTTTPQNVPSKSKVEKLRELKQLLDEKIITQEEFNIQKKKILEEEEK